MGYKVYENRKKQEEAKKLQEPANSPPSVMTRDSLCEESGAVEGIISDDENEEVIGREVMGPLGHISHFINKHVLLEDCLVEGQQPRGSNTSALIETESKEQPQAGKLSSQIRDRFDSDEDLNLTEEKRYAVMGNQGHSMVPLPQIDFR